MENVQFQGSRITLTFLKMKKSVLCKQSGREKEEGVKCLKARDKEHACSRLRVRDAEGSQQDLAAGVSSATIPREAQRRR